MNSSDVEFSKFATKKWYVIDIESNGSCSHHDSMESNLSDYSDAYILVTGNIAATGTIAAAGDNPIKKNQPLSTATQVEFKNWASLKNSRTEINDFTNIAMPMYNLIEHSDNYSDNSGSLWGLKKMR